MRKKSELFASQIKAERGKVADAEGRAKGANELRAQLKLQIEALEREG